MPPPLQALIDLGFDTDKFNIGQLAIVNGLKEVYTESVKINELRISPGAANSWTQLTQAQEKYSQALAKTALAKSKAEAADTVAKLKAIQLENEVIKQINLEQQANDRATAAIEKKNAAATKAANIKPADDPANANIPFTTNLAALQAEQEGLQQTGTVVNEFRQAELDAQLASSQWGEQIAENAAALGTLEVATNGASEATEANVVVTAADAKIAADASNDYKQLSIAYTEAALKAKNYAIQLGIDHPLSVEAANDAKNLSNTLKEVDASVGQNQRNVGNYGEAISNAFSKATNSTRVINRVVSQLSRQIITLGVGFLSFAIGAKAIELLTTYLVNLYEGIKQATKDQQLFIDVNKAAADSSSKQVAVLDVYKKKLDDLSIPEKDRVKIAQEYNKTADDSNKIALTQIDNLTEINTLIDQQIALIERQALAQAAEAKLAEQAAKVVDAELTLAENLRETGLNESDVKNANDAQNQEGLNNLNKGENSLDGGKNIIDRTSGTSDSLSKTSLSVSNQTKKLYNTVLNQRLEFERELDLLNPLISVDSLFGKDKKGGSDDGALKKLDDIAGQLRIIALQGQVDFNQSVEKNEQLSLDVRLGALRKSYLLQESLLKEHLDKGLRLNSEAEANTATELAGAKPGTTKYKNLQTDAENERGKAIVLQAKYNEDLIKLRRSGTEAAEKFDEDAAKRLQIAQEKIVKSNLELSNKAQQEIFKNETLNFSGRLQALTQYQINQSELIVNYANQEIATGKKTAKEIEAINDEKKNKLIELALQGKQELNDIYISSANAEENAAKQGLQGGEAAQELSLYNSLKNKAEFSEKSLALQNDEAQREIDIDKAKQEDILSSSQTTDAAKIKAKQDLDKDFEDQDKLNLKKAQDSEKQKEDLKKANRDLDVQLSTEAIDVVQAYEDAAFEKRQQQLQQELDTVKNNEQEKLDAIKTSTESATQQRAQEAQVEARANAQKRQLELQEKQNAAAKAKFDKEAAEAKIILNTSVAVTNAYTEGDPYTATIRAEIAAAAGIAELAIAQATPIPSYALGAGVNGRPLHKGGLAIFGEAGAEMIDEPGKKPYIAYKPTLASLAAGTKVTPMKNGDTMNDYLLHKAYANIDVKPTQVVDEKFLADSIVKGIGQHIATVTSAVSKQKAPVIHFTSHSDRADWIRKSVRE